MELHGIRGGTKEDLLAKKYLIGIGISLGNKWFTTANTIELIQWSLEYSRGQVIVYVADTIHAINLEVRNKILPERAARVAREKGAKMLADIQEEVDRQNLAGKERLVYATWADLGEPAFLDKVQWMREFYENDQELQTYIHTMVRGFVSEEDRPFGDEQIHKLGLYLVDEMPELVARVPIKGIVFDANVYPFGGGGEVLAHDIQLGKLFPKVKEKLLDTEPKVFLEVR